MTTSLVFTDGAGTLTLTNSKPFPGDRFRNWVPDTVTVSADVEALATGRPYPWVFSERYTATFSLEGIPNTKQEDVLRLVRWLKRGGAVDVHTGDAADRVYTGCYLPKGAAPSFTLSDQQLLEYTLSLTLLNGAGTPMRCEY